MDSLNKLLAELPADRPHIIFAGGCGSFGMNLTVYLYDSKLFIVDCGGGFAPDYQIGIDSHIPDIDPILEYYGGPAAYFITHGHEDHIGALPLFLKKWPAPVYMTKWTSLIFEDRLAKFGIRGDHSPNIVHPGDRLELDGIALDWFGVPHSIPGCCALTLYFGPYKIFHTGDFKMDPHPPSEQGPDLEYLESIAPVDLVVADSTNSTSTGFCPSETSVLEPLSAVISQSPNLVILTTFASNLWRLLSVIKICRQLDRRLYLVGGALSKTLDYATKLGFYTPDETLIVGEEALKSANRNELLILASGSQGEPRSGLRRIIYGEHRSLKLEPGDHIIFSSRIIPGNESSVLGLISQCHRQGVTVTTTKDRGDIHVSGHAYQEDIELLLGKLKPRFHIPVHGTFTQLTANGQLYEPSVAVANGSVVQLSDTGVDVVGEIPLERQFIDSWSQLPLGYETMRARHKIGDSGLILITAGKNLIPADIEFIGVPFDDAQQRELSTFIHSTIKAQSLQANDEDLNERVRRIVRKRVTDILIKKPVVICKLYSETSHAMAD